MKISQTQNKVTDKGLPYCVVFVGDVLFFGGNIQKYYEVTKIEKSRCFHNDTDLFQLEQDTKIVPIVFEK